MSQIFTSLQAELFINTRSQLSISSYHNILVTVPCLVRASFVYNVRHLDNLPSLINIGGNGSLSHHGSYLGGTRGGTPWLTITTTCVSHPLIISLKSRYQILSFISNLKHVFYLYAMTLGLFQCYIDSMICITLWILIVIKHPKLCLCFVFSMFDIKSIGNNV